MKKNITDEQLAAAVNNMIALRMTIGDPSTQFNLNFHPTLETCDARIPSVTYRFHTQPWMANPVFITHGGIICSLFDNSMGMTCGTFYGDMVPTLSLSTSFIRPVPIDRDVLVRVTLNHAGHCTSQMTGELFLPEAPSVILATALGIFHTASAPAEGADRFFKPSFEVSQAKKEIGH